MERCGRCRGDGYVWNDRDCRDILCPECGGDGYVDPYQEDEWYEEDDYEEYMYLWAWLQSDADNEVGDVFTTDTDQPLIPPSPIDLENGS